MKQGTKISKRVALFSMAFCVCSSVAWDSPQTRSDNSVTSLNYSQESTRTLVEIGVSSDPTFSVYTLKNPERVVVEILDCESENQVSPIQVRNGIVDTAAISVSKSNDYSTCRVILGLDRETTYSVDSSNERITVSVDGKPELKASELADAYEAMKKSQEEALASARSFAAQEQEEAQRARAEAAEASNREKAALEQLERAYAEAQQRVSALEAERNAAQQADLEALQSELFKAQANAAMLEKAKNEALERAQKAENQRDEAQAQVRESQQAMVKLQQEQEKAKRQQELQNTKLQQDQKSDAIEIAKAPSEVPPIDKSVGTSQPKSEVPIDAQAAAVASVRDIQFKNNPVDGSMQVVVKMSAPIGSVENVDLGSQKSALRIAGAVLPENFNKKFDTSALNQGIRFVDSKQDANGIELIAQASSKTIDSVEQNGDTLIWNLRPLRQATGNFAAPVDRRTQTMVNAAEPGDIIGQSTYGAAANLRDTPLAKRKITLDIHDADINDLFRLLADEINTSIVVSPEVKGNITLSLKSVPLDQALDIILRTHSLGMRYEGNVIWIAKDETFRAEEERAVKAAQMREKLEPLEIRMIPINYALADQIKNNVKNLLSSRGKIDIDIRTNTLILKDVAANLDAAEILVSNLDSQTPQILIEARIVETQANFTKEIGIQWGGDGVASAATGNATGIVFPSTIGIAGASTSDNNAGVSATPNFAVNLPASVGTGSGGALGITLGSLGGAINLNIRLSAMEEKGYLKIITSPRIMTLDNIQATIEQGTSIPITVVSAAGAQTSFIDANLKLQVTPHVTRDGNVYLKLDITKNEPDFGNRGADGNPSILKKQAHTELLVPDGDTTVIGGIYSRSTGQNMSSVPFWGSIPILGYLFRSTSETDNRNELLIFITPRIVNREASISAAGGTFIPPIEKDAGKD